MKRNLSVFLVLLLTTSFSFSQTSPDCSAVTISSATNSGTMPFATYLESDGILNGNDYFGATIYYPQNTTSTLASIIIVPGYANFESSMQNWGPFLASHGIVCMTIGTNSIWDLVNARKEALQDALISLKAENTRINSPLFNKLDTNRVALGGWSMGGGGAQLAAVEDSTIKAIIALCPWIDPAQASSFLLNQTVPIILFSGQIDAIAPPNTHANAHYNYTPNTTDKLIYEINLGGHTAANSPSGGQGEVGRMALSWLKKYLIEDSCHCPLLLDTPVTASVYQTNITCPIYGCTDLLACNYDSLANTDVNNCIYPTSSTTNIIECDTYTWNGQTYTTGGVYTYSTLNSNGCDSVATLNLTINNIYSITNTVNICFGDSITVGNNTYSQSGNYTDVFSSVNGCDSVVITNLNILQQITVIISQVGLAIKANPTSGSMPYVYEWNTGEITGQITPLVNGDYWVIVTDSNECISDTSFFKVEWMHTSVEDFNIDRLVIYPNPSRDMFNVEFTSLITQTLQVRIINSLGDIVFIDNLENYIGQYKKQINLNEYSKAIYFLEIQTNDGVINKKLILQ
jgi:hypothetical protein